MRNQFLNGQLSDVSDILIEQVLTNAVFDGFTAHCLEQSAQSVGIDVNLAQALFPSIPNDLYIYVEDFANRKMLAHQPPEIKGVRARIHSALMARYGFLARHRMAVARIAAHWAMPLNYPMSFRIVQETADILWRHAGDTSTDFNYYTKRGLLMGAIIATNLVFMNDSSDDLHETSEFLQNRLNNAVDLGRKLAEKPKIFDFMRQAHAFWRGSPFAMHNQ